MTRFVVMLFTKIKINPFFWVVIFLGILTGYFRTLIMLFCIIFIHELGHVTAAYYYRWRIKKIELLPFGGVAEVDEYGNRPFKEELIVILAGPFQHLWMITLAFLSIYLKWIDTEFYHSFINFNLMLLFFNLLPVWPLDGGKLLFLLFSKAFPYKKAHRYMICTSFSLLILLLIISNLFYPFQLNIWIIAIFLLFSHYTEWKHKDFLFMRFLMERMYQTNNNNRMEKIKTIVADPNKQIKDVLDLFYKGRRHEVIIKGSYTFNKIHEETLLKSVFHANTPNPKIKDLMI